MCGDSLFSTVLVVCLCVLVCVEHTCGGQRTAWGAGSHLPPWLFATVVIPCYLTRKLPGILLVPPPAPVELGDYRQNYRAHLDVGSGNAEASGSHACSASTLPTLPALHPVS